MPSRIETCHISEAGEKTNVKYVFPGEVALVKTIQGDSFLVGCDNDDIVTDVFETGLPIVRSDGLSFTRLSIFTVEKKIY